MRFQGPPLAPTHPTHPLSPGLSSTHHAGPPWEQSMGRGRDHRPLEAGGGRTGRPQREVMSPTSRGRRSSRRDTDNNEAEDNRPAAWLISH